MNKSRSARPSNFAGYLHKIDNLFSMAAQGIYGAYIEMAQIRLAPKKQIRHRADIR
jgi:hypothetical protein